MNEIFTIYMRLYLENKNKTGYLGNETVITPDLNIKIIKDNKLTDEFEEMVFFLSRRYTQTILEKLRTIISAKYPNSTVDYYIKKFDVSQQQLERMLSKQWKYEKA